MDWVTIYFFLKEESLLSDECAAGGVNKLFHCVVFDIYKNVKVDTGTNEEGKIYLIKVRVSLNVIFLYITYVGCSN